jgi:hypothetical protein
LNAWSRCTTQDNPLISRAKNLGLRSPSAMHCSKDALTSWIAQLSTVTRIILCRLSRLFWTFYLSFLETTAWVMCHSMI